MVWRSEVRFIYWGDWYLINKFFWPWCLDDDEKIGIIIIDMNWICGEILKNFLFNFLFFFYFRPKTNSSSPNNSSTCSPTSLSNTSSSEELESDAPSNIDSGVYSRNKNTNLVKHALLNYEKKKMEKRAMIGGQGQWMNHVWWGKLLFYR